MEIPEQLQCLFSARVTGGQDAYRIEVPENELQAGQLEEGERYRVALLEASTDPERTGGAADTDPDHPQPPVEEGDTRTVEIEDMGEQGDGLARVERGFVVIVPDTEQGERVTIEIADVQPNVAFADVVERVGHHE